MASASGRVRVLTEEEVHWITALALDDSYAALSLECINAIQWWSSTALDCLWQAGAVATVARAKNWRWVDIAAWRFDEDVDFAPYVDVLELAVQTDPPMTTPEEWYDRTSIIASLAFHIQHLLRISSQRSDFAALAPRCAAALEKARWMFGGRVANTCVLALETLEKLALRVV